MGKYVLVERDNRICTLTLNRPEVLNALNHDVFTQLRQAIDEIAKAGNDIGCVILKEIGRASCRERVCMFV